MTEKEIIEKILLERGIIDENGSFDKIKFNKLVTEPWIYSKTLKYGFNNLVGTKTVEIQEEVKEVVVEEQPIENQPIIEEVVEVPVVEAPEVEEVKEEIVEEAPAEKPAPELSPELDIVDEQPAPEAEEVKEEIVEEAPAEKSAPKKKSTKKK